MSTHHKTCFVILFIAITSVIAFLYPTKPNKEYHCEMNDTFVTHININCKVDNNSVFNIYINQLYGFTEITCINGTDLSDFNLNDVDIWNITFYFPRILVFHECNVSKNIKFSDIAHMLSARSTDIEDLRLRSHKNMILKKHYLDGFENLEYLYIVDCKNLILIEPNTFDKLKSLRYLNLKNNSLTELQSGIFDKLVALNYLDVSMNNLSSLPKDIFAKLTNLSILYLEKNNFRHLLNDLRNNTELIKVDLSNQKNLTLSDGFFSNLTKLEILILTNNGLSKLSENFFWGLSSLTTIMLSNNYLQFLPTKIFKKLRMLKTLSLDCNNLEDLSDNIFSSANQLETLDLSNNRIRSISEQFVRLYSLRELNIERNHLETISHYSFSYSRNLKVLKLSNNYLILQSPWFSTSPFFNCNSLRELHLAHNNISKIFEDWLKHKNLYKLDLSYNNISSIKTEDLLFSSNNILVNLTHNKIQQILLHDAKYIIKEKAKTYRNVTILMENNPLNCNCDMYDFIYYNEGEMRDVQSHFQIELKNLTCQSPKEMKKEQIYSKNFTCKIKNTDSITVCSEKCNCFLKPHDKAFIFDCSNKNLTDVPNDIKEPNISSIQSFTKSIDTILQLQLNFSHNRLTQMPDLKKLGLKSVNKLSLSYNNIFNISLNGLSTTLKVLELHNNNLSRIESNVLRFWKNAINLTYLTLHENPWECDCDAKNFYNFISFKSKIIEVSKVTCHKQNASILELTWNDFCPSDIIDTTVIISSSAAITFIGLIIGIFGLYYKYQTYIKIWLFKHQWCLWFVTEDELDKNKLYDAFVSFSHKDEDFIVNELVPKLESGPTPFKLCLHYRDWLAGEWIPDHIVRSVENSRRTVIVLSPNFLESVWGRMEFRVAHCQALNEGRTRVILILYSDIGSTDNLDPELKTYMSMNTYIKWGDPWFWDKLRYALPHQSRRPRSTHVRRKLENYEL